MVLPLVALGLLGAGYAGKNVMGDFFDERREKRQGARFDEAMAGAAPGMENRALASAGLLDPNEWATMQQRTAEGALDRDAAWDRMAFGEAGVNNRFERGMAFDQMQADNEALRAEGQRVFEATSTLRDEYQPQLDRYSDFIAENEGINTLLADIRGMNPAERDLWIKSQDAVAAQAQLAEAQERQFTAWIMENKPAGDAPSAEEIERLRGSFLQAEGDIVDMFTNKRFDQAIEINNRRNARYGVQAQTLEDRYNRDLEAAINGTGPRFSRNRDLVPSREIEGRDLSPYVNSRMSPTDPGGGGGSAPGDPAPAGPLPSGGRGASGRNAPRVSKSSRGSGEFSAQALRDSESAGSGGDRAANSEGYVGAMQFGDARLEDFRRASGRSFTKEEFRQNSDLQREVEEWHIGDIGRFVQRNGLDRYAGATIAGVPVTPAGMVWAAHIGGKGGMKKFLESGGRYNPADSNGITIAEYMRRGATRG